MDREAIIAAVEASGIPCIYGWYEEGNEPEYPYCVLNYLMTDTFFADGAPWFHHDRWQLDLIDGHRSEATERDLEKALLAGGLLFSRMASSDEGGAYRTIYRFMTGRKENDS